MIPTLLIIGLLFASLAFSDTLLHGIDVSKPEKKKTPVKKDKQLFPNDIGIVKFSDFKIEEIQQLRCNYAIRICCIDLKGEYLWIDYFYQNGNGETLGKIKKGSYTLSTRDSEYLISTAEYPKIEKKLKDYFKMHPSVKKEVGKFFNV